VKNDIANLVTETSIDPERAKHLINELQSKNDYANRFRTSLTRSQIELIQKQKDLKKIDDDLSELVKEDLPAWLEEKKQLLIDFKEIAYSTRDRVFKKLVKQLEDEANKHYHQMMQGNLSAKGIIKLVESTKGNFMPRLVDEFGNPLLQLNTGNIILIKLATIMAIISARQGSRDTDLYTLITDAPMSVFGEDYTIGFCKTVSTVYRQSIIMSKEFYKNETLRRQLLTDSNINLGKVYMISPSLPENERSNRNSLSTIIKALN
jgi:DNA sulfur modification protein DndD